jgi:hypothetical protein
MSNYEAFLVAAIAGYFWELANTHKNTNVRPFLRAASFVFATLSLGFLMLTHAKLIAK